LEWLQEAKANNDELIEAYLLLNCSFSDILIEIYLIRFNVVKRIKNMRPQISIYITEKYRKNFVWSIHL